MLSELSGSFIYFYIILVSFKITEIFKIPQFGWNISNEKFRNVRLLLQNYDRFNAYTFSFSSFLNDIDKVWEFTLVYIYHMLLKHKLLEQQRRSRKNQCIVFNYLQTVYTLLLQHYIPFNVADFCNCFNICLHFYLIFLFCESNSSLYLLNFFGPLIFYLFFPVSRYLYFHSFGQSNAGGEFYSETTV